jgi:hypothetical protein
MRKVISIAVTSVVLSLSSLTAQATPVHVATSLAAFSTDELSGASLSVMIGGTKASHACFGTASSAACDHRRVTGTRVASSCWCADFKKVCVGWVHDICVQWLDECISRLCN